MKVTKRVTIIADILCDEDFDYNQFLIAQNIGNDASMDYVFQMDSPPVYVGRGVEDEWEVLDYVFQNDVEIIDEVEE